MILSGTLELFHWCSPTEFMIKFRSTTMKILYAFDNFRFFLSFCSKQGDKATNTQLGVAKSEGN